MTGAAGQIAYSLLYSIAKGDVFGKDQVTLTPELHRNEGMDVRTAALPEAGFLTGSGLPMCK